MMKLAVLLALAAVVISGCSTTDNSGQGATGDEYFNGETGWGNAAGSRDPGGLNRASGQYANPNLPPDNSGNDPY